jgi:penicillin-insensitive murein DD-endopeptidase
MGRKEPDLQLAVSFALTLALLATPALSAESVCFGKESSGRLEGGVKLPLSGRNFSPYSDVASDHGRTYVHSRVRDVVVAAYAAMEKAAPGGVFVYGETGLAFGGRFPPHRTHQNGLSVDFFVPVRDTAGRPAKLPADASNRFGYNIEFDAEGRYEEYSIDFKALSEHLYQLHAVGKERGVGIRIVILDPPYLPKLFATPRGPFLKQNVRFLKGPAWVRHDEHYHVDFAVPCRPMKD